MEDHVITELYSNTNNTVYKYVHANGAETTVKTVPTCIDSDSDIYRDTNKAVLFLSVSAGCKQGCKFCHLTAKGFKHHPIDTDTIIKSGINALKASAKQIKGRYLKISFMGMGDVFCSQTIMSEVVKKIFLYAYRYSLIKGIDGVDIGTSYPLVDTTATYEEITRTSEVLYFLDMPFNPVHNYVPEFVENSTDRTPVRLFISLHSTHDNVRKALMPNTSALSRIYDEVSKTSNDVIFHYILFDGINDSVEALESLVHAFTETCLAKYELRLLRFNGLKNIELHESPKTEEVIQIFKKSPLHFKYQVSAGKEISAACGQFLCSN